MTILILGSNGFIGQALTAHFAAQGQSVLRGQRQNHDGSDDVLTYGDLATEDFSWDSVFSTINQKITAIVYLAGYASVPKDVNEETFRKVNILRPQECVTAMAKHFPAARFVFFSSASARKLETTEDEVITEETVAEPNLPLYAKSKSDARDGVVKTATQTGVTYTILAPSAVVGARMKSLTILNPINMLKAGVDLSKDRERFGKANADNPRPFVSINTVCAMTQGAVEVTETSNQTYLLCDQNLSLKGVFQNLLNANSNAFPEPTEQNNSWAKDLTYLNNRKMLRCSGTKAQSLLEQSTEDAAANLREALRAATECYLQHHQAAA